MSTAPSESRGRKRSETSAPADGASALFRDLKMAIEYRPIGTLKAYATNPRSHPPEQLSLLSNSIRAFGLVMPVIIDENDTLVGGHGVLLVAEQLGYAEIPVIQLQHLSEAEKKTLRIALNRCAELALWDKDLLKVEFQSLLIDPNLSVDFDLSLSGFAMPEIYRITDEGAAQDDADDLTEEPNRREQAVSRIGDTFLLEEHSITNGNACDAASYSALLGDERAAVGLHDAPYNLATRRISKSGRHADFVFAHGERSRRS